MFSQGKMFEQIIANIDMSESEDIHIAEKHPVDPYGICADIRSDLSFDEFQKNRHELWGSSKD